MLENFGMGDFNPNVWNPTDYWTVSHGPSPPNGCYHPSECAWSGPFHAANSQMVLNFSFDRVWLNYSSLLLNFSLWVDTNPGDTLYVEYYNNGWNSAAQYSGHLSTSAPLNKTFLSQWILPQLKVPTTTTMMRFRLTGGCCEPLNGGVYVGDLGVYMVGPRSFSKLTVFWNGRSGINIHSRLTRQLALPQHVHNAHCKPRAFLPSIPGKSHTIRSFDLLRRHNNIHVLFLV